MQKVTYRGPSGAYHIKRGGKRYVLRAGEETEVPEDVAKVLAETDGHRFDGAKKAPTPSGSGGGGKATTPKKESEHMALVNHPFPYDIDNLLSGAVSVIYADPTDVPVPEGIEDVMEMVAPYDLVTGWNWLGATSEAFSYTRGFETEGLEIQQVPGAILEEVSDISRSIEVSMAEFSPFHFQLMENAPSVESISAAAGASAQDKVGFGGFNSVARYRFAFVSRRPVASGLVTEPGGKTRGRFVMGVAYAAQMTADDITMEQGKGALTAAGITFGLFPETTDPQPEGQDVGAWFLERSGTIGA